MIAPAFDVLKSGRMAVFQDPTGAFISVWQPDEMQGAQVTRERMSGGPIKARRFLLEQMAKPDPEVDKWYGGKPAEPALRRVREVILRADPRMTEYLKYGTVQFAYDGDFANFVQHNQKTVSLMFNRGARIPGRFPHLEGDGPSARFMRFKDVPEVNARAAELTKVVAAWCALSKR